MILKSFAISLLSLPLALSSGATQSAVSNYSTDNAYYFDWSQFDFYLKQSWLNNLGNTLTMALYYGNNSVTTWRITLPTESTSITSGLYQFDTTLNNYIMSLFSFGFDTSFSLDPYKTPAYDDYGFKDYTSDFDSLPYVLSKSQFRNKSSSFSAIRLDRFNMYNNNLSVGDFSYGNGLYSDYFHSSINSWDTFIPGFQDHLYNLVGSRFYFHSFTDNVFKGVMPIYYAAYYSSINTSYRYHFSSVPNTWFYYGNLVNNTSPSLIDIVNYCYSRSFVYVGDYNTYISTTYNSSNTCLWFTNEDLSYSYRPLIDSANTLNSLKLTLIDNVYYFVNPSGQVPFRYIDIYYYHSNCDTPLLFSSNAVITTGVPYSIESSDNGYYFRVDSNQVSTLTYNISVLEHDIHLTSDINFFADKSVLYYDSSDISLYSYILGILDSPFYMLWGMFNFTIFGFNFTPLFIALLCSALFLMVVRMLTGGFNTILNVDSKVNYISRNIKARSVKSTNDIDTDSNITQEQ